MTRPMKDSGIEWIGEIPQGWSISKVKRFFETTLGKMLQPNPKNDNEELLDYLCSANITWGGIDLSSIKKMWFSPNEKEHYRLKTGDLLVTEGGDVAVSFLWNGELDECYIQNAIHRVRSHEGSFNKFLYYLLYTLKHSGYIDLICNKATIAHFTKEKLGETPFIVCGFDEQVTISNFLDFKCAQIDRVIASKQKTNKLLKERRQSIIYEAVTKGLDRNALMKDSGIKWIGEIPVGWEVTRTKFLFDVVNGATPRSGNSEYWEGCIPWITPADFVTGRKYITEPRKYITEKGLNSCGTRLVPEDSIIVSTRAPIGSIAVAASQLCTNQGCKSLVRKGDLCSDYFYYFLSVMGSVLNALGKGTTFLELSSINLGDFYLLVPMIEEQQAISNYLDDKCGEIDRLIRANNLTIEKLIEYRQSIIFEAVTGKMEVPRTCRGR